MLFFGVRRGVSIKSRFANSNAADFRLSRLSLASSLAFTRGVLPYKIHSMTIPIALTLGVLPHAKRGAHAQTFLLQFGGHFKFLKFKPDKMEVKMTTEEGLSFDELCSPEKLETEVLAFELRRKQVRNLFSK